MGDSQSDKLFGEWSEYLPENFLLEFPRILRHGKTFTSPRDSHVHQGFFQAIRYSRRIHCRNPRREVPFQCLDILRDDRAHHNGRLGTGITQMNGVVVIRFRLTKVVSHIGANGRFMDGIASFGLILDLVPPRKRVACPYGST